MSRLHVDVRIQRMGVIGTLTLCAGVLGCHVPPRTDPTPCFGERLAVAVRNSTTNTVDVYMHTGSSQNGSHLGPVPVGGAQLGLPATDPGTSIRFTARRPDGSTIAPAFGNRREHSLITYSVVCSG